ncbi:MAG: acyl-CoA dehydrogenase family protein [Bacillota bacterium]
MDYFDLNLNLTDEDIDLKKAAHKFAKEVMRPVARQLDTMSAEEAVAEGSPVWDFLKKAYELGYHSILLPAEAGGPGLTPLQIHLVYEELGWGSFGLAVLLGVCSFPFYMAARTALITGDNGLVEKFVKPFCMCRDGSMRGCWAITEPDHGSDISGKGQEFFTDPNVRYNLQAVLNGDDWVLNGQKSAWVSNGVLATHAVLFAGVDPSMGLAGGGIFFCPLEIDGVSKGKALDKIGQRDLNQGEIYFDNARIPKNYLLFGPEVYVPMLDATVAGANTCMGIFATGLARAAFEEAFKYAKERVQGGKTIIEHTSVKQRLFDMFARVEACRALSRAVSNFNMSTVMPVLEYSMASKTRCTQMAFENAHEAVQLLGGNGLTREYLTEKFFRDARASLIEDGCNEMLAAEGGHILSETYPR